MYKPILPFFTCLECNWFQKYAFAPQQMSFPSLYAYNLPPHPRASFVSNHPSMHASGDFSNVYARSALWHELLNFVQHSLVQEPRGLLPCASVDHLHSRAVSLGMGSPWTHVSMFMQTTGQDNAVATGGDATDAQVRNDRHNRSPVHVGNVEHAQVNDTRASNSSTNTSHGVHSISQTMQLSFTSRHIGASHNGCIFALCMQRVDARGYVQSLLRHCVLLWLTPDL